MTVNLIPPDNERKELRTEAEDGRTKNSCITLGSAGLGSQPGVDVEPFALEILPCRGCSDLLCIRYPPVV